MYHGDIRLADTIDIKFCTVSTTGAPTTLAGTPVVSAYVGNGLTQITAGVTLTVDFDAVTGLHNVRVVASGANGFATATNVQLVITTGTVGGTSVVGYVIGSFSIENRLLAPSAINAAAFAAGAIDAAAIASGAIDADAIAANAIGASEIADGAIDAAAFAAGAIDATAIANGAIDAATFAAGAIDAAAIANGAIDAATFAAGAIDAAAIAADAIGASELAADAVDEIWDEAMTELSQAAPSATPAMRALVSMLYMMARNAVTVTSSSKTFSNDAGTVVFKKALTDDGTTYTEAEMATGP